ncbi:glyoxalase superfamily protein [Sphingomonas sp. LB-2]|uniref:glyoxalase superfamily protein n=1 Tax=Sphingomonas caeni TaxID=2984949 RepID=UPI002231BFDF|nr:glyoxalase superfamily protein [Sphingomonas caeni]MCW3846054.1 glyoxalase superfamily protein [Sphingomonas caeni]
MTMLKGVVPILHVRDVSATAAWFEARLGFAVDFLHGSPPFYGAVSRDGVCLHLRHVHEPLFAQMAAQEVSLIAASVEVSDVAELFEELSERGAEIAQPLTRHDWGGTDFHVRDPDGNVVSFVRYGPGE